MTGFDLIRVRSAWRRRRPDRPRTVRLTIDQATSPSRPKPRLRGSAGSGRGCASRTPRCGWPSRSSCPQINGQSVRDAGRAGGDHLRHDRGKFDGRDRRARGAPGERPATTGSTGGTTTGTSTGQTLFSNDSVAYGLVLSIPIDLSGALHANLRSAEADAPKPAADASSRPMNDARLNARSRRSWMSCAPRRTWPSSSQAVDERPGAGRAGPSPAGTGPDREDRRRPPQRPGRPEPERPRGRPEPVRARRLRPEPRARAADRHARRRGGCDDACRRRSGRRGRARPVSPGRRGPTCSPRGRRLDVARPRSGPPPST